VFVLSKDVDGFEDEIFGDGMDCSRVSDVVCAFFGLHCLKIGPEADW
jgi:hypothetical protein